MHKFTGKGAGVGVGKKINPKKQFSENSRWRKKEKISLFFLLLVNDHIFTPQMEPLGTSSVAAKADPFGPPGTFLSGFSHPHHALPICLGTDSSRRA